MPIANRQTKLAKRIEDEQAVFRLYSLGVSTNRDEWVYDFDVPNLRDKALFFSDTYNEFVNMGKGSHDPIIKWSETLRDHFRQQRRIIYTEANRIQSVYRPFTMKHYFADTVMSDRLTRNHYEMFGQDLRRDNKVICFLGSGARRPFAGNRHYQTSFPGDVYRRYAVPPPLPLHARRRARQQHHRLGHPAHQRPLPRGVGARTSTASTRTASTPGRYSPTPTPCCTTRYTATTTPPTCSASSHACPCTTIRHLGADGRELLDLHIGFESIEPYPLSAWRSHPRQDEEGRSRGIPLQCPPGPAIPSQGGSRRAL